MIVKPTLSSMIPTFPSTGEKSKGFEFEIKFNNLLKKYQEAFDQLEQDFQGLQNSPSQEGVASLSKKLDAIKIIRSKLNKKDLFTKPIEDELKLHSSIFKQFKFYEGQFLAATDQLHFKNVEEAVLQAKALENSIDIKEIRKVSEEEGRKLFRIYCSDLRKVIACYDYALKAGKDEVRNDYENAISNYCVFKKFEENIVNKPGYEFRYSINAIVGNNVLFPLEYHDIRLPNALEILVASPDKGGLKEKCQTLVFQLLCLPPKTDLQMVLMEVAKEIICSESFQKGKKDWDEEYLNDHREEKLEFLDKLINIAKNEMKPVDMKDVPSKLDVNTKMTTHPRLFLLRAAHRLGISLNDRFEWNIDTWMAELRQQFLKGYAPDKEQLLYLSRRHQKPLGLLLNSQEDPYHPELIQDKYRNLTEMSMHHMVFRDRYEDVLTENKQIDYVLEQANQSSRLKLMLPESYFEKDHLEKLSRAGARALLFTAGYLKK